MALIADVLIDGASVSIELHRSRNAAVVADDPDMPDTAELALPRWRWIFWDAEKLEHGEREFAGLELLDVTHLDEAAIDSIERLDLPRLDCRDAGLYDATVADVLRWAKRSYVGREETAKKADAA